MTTTTQAPAKPVRDELVEQFRQLSDETLTALYAQIDDVIPDLRYVIGALTRSQAGMAGSLLAVTLTNLQGRLAAIASAIALNVAETPQPGDTDHD